MTNDDYAPNPVSAIGEDVLITLAAYALAHLYTAIEHKNGIAIPSDVIALQDCDILMRGMSQASRKRVAQCAQEYAKGIDVNGLKMMPDGHELESLLVAILHREPR